MFASEQTPAGMQRQENGEHLLLPLLAQISQTLVIGLQLSELLGSVVSHTKELLQSDLCLIWLLDQSHYDLTLAASYPARSLSDQPHFAFDRQIQVTLLNLNEHLLFQEMDALITRELQAALNASVQHVLAAPLVVKTDFLGLICCANHIPQNPSSFIDDHLLLRVIANQIALTVRLWQGEKGLMPDDFVQQFLDDLFRLTPERANEQEDESLQRRANLLGIDLTLPHAVAILEINLEERQKLQETALVEKRLAHTHSVFNEIKARLEQAYPGSLAAPSKDALTVTCLIALNNNPGPLHLWLRDLYLDLLKQEVRLFIGLSNIYQSMNGYPLAYQEAMNALAYGTKINPAGGVLHIKDLGVFQYLDHRIASDRHLNNPYLNAIRLVAAYDERKGADLLKTLEAWLLSGGKAKKTSERLKQLGVDIHHNTVEQRIARINEEVHESDINIEDSEHWADLINAIRLHKLQQG